MRDTANCKRIGSRLLVVLTVLLVAAGAIRAESRQVMVDTTWEGWPDAPKVYNTAKAGTGGRTVPMVDLDTNSYEKKLWLAEKQRISIGGQSATQGKVIAWDSVVFAIFSSLDENDWYVNAVSSIDYGATWGDPQAVQTTGRYTSGHPDLSLGSNRVLFAHSAYFPELGFLYQLLSRCVDAESLTIHDSTVVDTTMSSSSSVYGPRLLSTDTTLLISYFHHYDYANHFKFAVSSDSGRQWYPINSENLTAAGIPYSMLEVGDNLCIVCRSSDEVRFNISDDGAQTWSADYWVSTPDEYASQLPAACSDGDDAVHVVWYDFDGASPGWSGWVFYRKFNNSSGTWGNVGALSSGPFAESVEIWADTARVYCVWNDSRFGSPDYGLFLRYSHDSGSTWSSEIQIVDETDPAWEPDVYAQGDLVYIVWHEQHPPDWEWEVQFILGVWYLPGDVDLSEGIDIADLVYMVDWMFTGGPAPVAYDAAQMDGLGTVDIADLVYIVDYMFDNGPPPVGGEGL